MRGVTKAFAEGPPAIIRVENVGHPDECVKQPGMPTPRDAAWSVKATSRRSRALAESEGAREAPDIVHSTVNDVATQVCTAPKFEIERYSAVLFSLSLKEAGVEKARVEARARPGTQRR